MVDFEDFWKMAIKANTGGNGLCYHECCDVWTTRAARIMRDSHQTKLSWRKFMADVDKSVDDGMVAFRAKLAQNNWRSDVVVNKSCRFQSAKSGLQQSGFRLRQSDIQPQDVQAGLSSLDFAYPGQLLSGLVSPLSIHYLT